MIVPPEDPNAIAQAVKYLLDNPEQARRLSERAFNKVKEFTWGKALVEKFGLQKKVKKQWTTDFGETIVKELYTLLGDSPIESEPKTGIEIDFETTEKIIEVKTGTWWTGGTAHQKIFGVPFHYSEVPVLFKKPLVIVCVGRAEEVCWKAGFLGGTYCTERRREQLALFERQGITAIGASELLAQIIEKNTS